ncbi:e2d7ecf4-0389-4808-9504-bd1503b0e259-CDS [Sclerotinia trifoliorum]|uniref:E2d7ecf4-0389-4808-9504-bd1503b0e259-CDS n=1 Tax=Sclerotinia trifoliorum TaxID=28548 RepID=A0A8H2ZKV7_9HELO|nr:e2d7ecf4-0389-4808-9504-bd1503b0e259-CDS [Sclerotinia trifoliorum]
MTPHITQMSRHQAETLDFIAPREFLPIPDEYSFIMQTSKEAEDFLDCSPQNLAHHASLKHKALSGICERQHIPCSWTRDKSQSPSQRGHCTKYIWYSLCRVFGSGESGVWHRMVLSCPPIVRAEQMESTSTASKVKELMKDINQNQTEGKSIIFSCWTTALDLVGHHLKLCGLPFERVDGSCTHAQQHEDTRILIMTTGTGAEGSVSLYPRDSH